MTNGDLTRKQNSSNNRTMQGPTRAKVSFACIASFALRTFFTTLLFVSNLLTSSGWANSGQQPQPNFTLAEPELFGFSTPLGRFSYLPGRGLRIGQTGFTIGGFATAEMEHLENGERRGSFEEIKFLLSYNPVPFAQFFSELGVGPLASLLLFCFSYRHSASDKTAVLR
jgi:hypothetical protein